MRIRHVRDANDPALRLAHRLLRNCFHSPELLPLRAWQEVLQEAEQGLWTDTDWHLFVAEAGERVVGAASGNYIGNLNVGLVGYVAVQSRARDSGLGSRLRHALRRAFARDALRVRGRELDAIVGEVRADNPWLRHLVAHRGAIALDFPYEQPSIEGRGEVPLVLYYEPLTRTRGSLGAGEVRRLLYAMWRRPYRIPRPLSDPVFRRMIASLEGRRTIGQRALPDPIRRPGRAPASAAPPRGGAPRRRGRARPPGR